MSKKRLPKKQFQEGSSYTLEKRMSIGHYRPQARVVAITNPTFELDGRRPAYAVYHEGSSEWLFFDMDLRMVASRFDLDIVRTEQDLEDMYSDNSQHVIYG